jgi:ketosteroid isomerase-like protein
VSQEAQNVEAVRQGFHALRVGGVEALLPFFATDVVMHPFVEWPDDPVYFLARREARGRSHRPERLR